jgi:L-iditol 2-dehydrogenase
MKVTLLYEPKRVEISEIDEPQLGPVDVRVKPKLSGICGSDISLFMGHRVASMTVSKRTKRNNVI